jgi:predicted nuclease of predicted toxin-antitoxin system
MRFLVDECTGLGVAAWLRERGHDVFSAYEQAQGADDEALLRRAFAENRILITNDKDFGEKVFRDGIPHKGVVLLRLEDERTGKKIAVLQKLLDGYADRLAGRFVAISEMAVRIVGDT